MINSAAAIIGLARRMTLRFMFSTLFAATLLASPALALNADGGTAAERTPPERPSSMSSREIAAYNEGLDRRDPQYIRCRKSLQTGSLVRTRRVCHTNEQWQEVFESGNDNARDELERLAPQGTRGN